MYTIKVYENTKMLQKIPRIKVYNKLTKPLLLTISFIVCTLIVIILQGLYPAPIMDLLEKVGVIEYTEATNAKITITYDRYGGYPTKNYYLTGNYYDKSNKLHEVDISLNLADRRYSRSNLHQNNNKCPIAYYSFYPDYDILRIPSTFSLCLAYTILSVACIYLFSILYRRRKVSLLLSSFKIGKLVRPVMFRKQKVTTKNSYHYSYLAIWETPNGNRWDLSPIKEQNDVVSTLEFPEEYCGIYIKGNKGEELIIHPKDVKRIIAKFGYKIKDLDVTVSQAFRRNLSHGDGGESNQNSRTHHKNSRNNRHGHGRNK